MKNQHEDCAMFYEFGTDRFFGPMTSFASFYTVKVFLQSTESETERHPLINVFPSNLESLALNNCHECLQSLLEAVEHLLAQDSPPQVPSLKEIILSYQDIRNVPWNIGGAALERLSTVAATRGVSIELI